MRFFNVISVFLNVVLIVVLIVVLNSKPDYAKPLSPQYAAHLAKLHTYHDNFSEFDDLVLKFSDIDNKERSKEFFNNLKGISSTDVRLGTYVHMSNKSGENFLIKYVESNEFPKMYYIYDMITIPNEFNELLNSK